MLTFVNRQVLVLVLGHLGRGLGADHRSAAGAALFLLGMAAGSKRQNGSGGDKGKDGFHVCGFELVLVSAPITDA